MSWFHTRMVMPYAEPDRYTGLAHRLSRLARFERLSADAQRAEQHTRVRRLMQHAYRTTPFYREAFDEARFDPDDWTPRQTAPLPLVTKDTIRERGDDLLSRAYSPETLRSAQTGGTTGPPVRIWRDLDSLRDKVALQIHLERQRGYEPGDSVLMIWGADRDLELNPSWKWRLYQQTLMRQQAAPVGSLSDAVFARFYGKLQQHRPKVIYGYAGCVARFAEYVSRQGDGGRRNSVRTVMVTAEQLTEGDRALIERVFGARVIEFYGSRDIGMVASQCVSPGNLHFHPAACFVEFLPEGDSPEGPLFRLVLTDLLNSAFPLIRFDTADCVLLEERPCACGLWHPHVKKIMGRAIDNFKLRDGTRVSGVAMTNQMLKLKEELRAITGIQFVQKEYDLIQVRFSAKGEETVISEEMRAVTSLIGELFPPGLFWVETRVPEIAREASGKLRYTISEVVA